MIDQLKGIFLLILLYIAGALAASWMPIGIPGAVIGLVLCLAAMIALPGLQEIIRPGALVVLALVPLFLVPLLVRMALTLDFTTGETWLIVFATALATIIGVLITGLAAKFALSDEEGG